MSSWGELMFVPRCFLRLSFPYLFCLFTLSLTTSISLCHSHKKKNKLYFNLKFRPYVTF